MKTCLKTFRMVVLLAAVHLLSIASYAKPDSSNVVTEADFTIDISDNIDYILSGKEQKEKEIFGWLARKIVNWVAS